eukprot:CAMPEP_0173453524 /NCGR_PEP_ID=MMETSP1357-20121228/50768_1 /TAXON_ID=77926 /ORGANISM="Hemiselmis rufescens, Strain PCC563" /LENGTH=61 /DNA_ID=CAMNT_0014420491 /DNA_START=18 /DNA_END=199 /DNA_ORIENTATION=-
MSPKELLRVISSASPSPEEHLKALKRLSSLATEGCSPKQATELAREANSLASAVQSAIASR